MTAPKPAPCPRHPDMEPVLLPIFLGQLRDVEYRVVDCGVFGCWRGPMARTEAEAVALWNTVVAPDATRLAAVVRAAKGLVKRQHHPDALEDLLDAVRVINKDDLALLERWGKG